MNRQSGFTLIELVVILVLVAILAAVALPKFFNLDVYRTRAAYDEVVTAIRYGQKLAVASGCEVQVSLSGNGYALQQHATTCTSGPFTTITDHPVTSSTFSAVTISATPNSFRFDPIGRCSVAVTGDVDGETFQVIAETGYVDTP